jgi:HPt (histidine-containing phosphotransfer) domain-containing protein
MAQVRQAIQQRDTKALYRAAHALKGTIANFTTGRAFEAIAALETLAQNHDMEHIEVATTDLNQALNDLEKALVQFSGSAAIGAV